MKNNIDRIISFKLCGKFAHFRKFYTNSSSLSYLIPPRTVIIGLLASILKIPRDEYYNLFSEENCKVSISIPFGLEIRKQTQSMNYLHNKYFNLLAKGSGKVQHSQCKLELLMAPANGNIEYMVYIGFSDVIYVFKELEKKLINNNLGFGLYLGQRQFRCYIRDFQSYSSSEFEFMESSDYLDSICSEENFIDFFPDEEISISNEQMPIHFKKVETKNSKGREPVTVKQIYFEQKGKRLTGNFLNCYKIGDKVISFF